MGHVGLRHRLLPTLLLVRWHPLQGLRFWQRGLHWGLLCQSGRGSQCEYRLRQAQGIRHQEPGESLSSGIRIIDLDIDMDIDIDIDIDIDMSIYIYIYVYIYICVYIYI